MSPAGPIVRRTARLIIRPTGASDLDFVLEAERHPDNAPWVGAWSRLRHAEACADPDWAHWLLVRREDDVPVGYALLSGLDGPNRNVHLKRIVVTAKDRGLGREAIEACMAEAFGKLRAHRFWLDVKTGNARGVHLYESTGFVREGVLRECLAEDGGRRESLVVMSVLRDEYERRGGRAAPPATPEQVTVLHEADGVRVERIVSRGHVSPPGLWYDSPEHEWVMLLAGAAELSFADGRRVRLASGEHLHLRAHERHRVDWTDPARETVWLAVHHR